jgi:hypothetical protein
LCWWCAGRACDMAAWRGDPVGLSMTLLDPVHRGRCWGVKVKVGRKLGACQSVQTSSDQVR